MFPVNKQGKKKKSLNGTNNQNKFSFNKNKTQQINSFEYLNPNHYNQEPYQKVSQKKKKKIQKSTSTQNQNPISALNPKPNPTNQNLL